MSDSETSDHLEFEAFEALEAMRDMVLPDDGYITRGAQMMEWIRNPNDPTCPGSISMLTWEEIFESADEVDRSVNFTPLASLERDIVLPSQTDFPRQETDYLHWTLTYDSATNYSVGHWEGLTVKGAIVHWGVARSVNGNEVGIPFMSQVSLALYERHHGSTEDLRYVFFCSVINSQTGRFVRGLYSGWDQDNPPQRQLHAWPSGSREYLGIMGTRIGRMMGFIMLGAFERGTHGIECINTYRHGNSVCLRFDIAELSQE